MSGHSKWHNIRVKKTAADAARGKVYTKHAKMIEIAAQRGGDPVTNTALKNAIAEAKADSVPNANIERAIKKGTGELKGERMEEVLYACMAPGGVACLIECLTDNTNRTLGNVKTIISKNGGTFTESSSVLWMFARRGVVVARSTGSGQAPKAGADIEGLELELIDFGAEDVDAEGDTVTVTTDIAGWTKTRDFLKQSGWEILSAGLRYVATQKAPLPDEKALEQLAEFVAAIEEDDDVSEVHTNADF
jgi:YebC/PmpR family DNA-binding regulatory protein